MLLLFQNEVSSVVVSFLLLPVSHYGKVCTLIGLEVLDSGIFSGIAHRKQRQTGEENERVCVYIYIYIYISSPVYIFIYIYVYYNIFTNTFFKKLYSHCKMIWYRKVKLLQSDVVFSYLQPSPICISREPKQFSFSLVSF